MRARLLSFLTMTFLVVASFPAFAQDASTFVCVPGTSDVVCTIVGVDPDSAGEATLLFTKAAVDDATTATATGAGVADAAGVMTMSISFPTGFGPLDPFSGNFIGQLAGEIIDLVTDFEPPLPAPVLAATGADDTAPLAILALAMIGCGATMAAPPRRVRSRA